MGEGIHYFKVCGLSMVATTRKCCNAIGPFDPGRLLIVVAFCFFVCFFVNDINFILGGGFSPMCTRGVSFYFWFIY